MKKYLNLSMSYLAIGLAMGVFYREFTKMNGFEGQTVLGGVHSHALVLHNVVLIYMLSTLVVRWVLQVTGGDFAGLSHIAG